MSDKILKKSLFGGFSKGSVLDYVEAIQQENVSLSEKAEELDSVLDKAEYLEKQVASLSEENEALKKQIEDLKSDNDALLKKNAEIELRNEELSVNISNLENKEEPSAQHDAGPNILIQNAMDYSDKLVAAAREAANDILSKAGSTVKDVNDKVLVANDKLRTARYNLDCSLGSVKESMDGLIKELDNAMSGLNNGIRK